MGREARKAGMHRQSVATVPLLTDWQIDAPRMKTLEEWEAEKKQKELDKRNKNPQMRSLAENSMKVRA